MIREAIGKVVTGTDLDEQEMIGVMNEIMSGEATDAQISCFITALRMKGETVDEIVGAVKVMREKATFVNTGVKTDEGEILLQGGEAGEISMNIDGLIGEEGRDLELPDNDPPLGKIENTLRQPVELSEAAYEDIALRHFGGPPLLVGSA